MECSGQAIERGLEGPNLRLCAADQLVPRSFRDPSRFGVDDPHGGTDSAWRKHVAIDVAVMGARGAGERGAGE